MRCVHRWGAGADKIEKMSSVTALRAGRYAVLEAEWDLTGPAAIGILLEDPSTNELHIRLRRDWAQLDPEDPVLPLLEEDLRNKADEWGAERLLEWLEENLSANLRISDRETVAVDEFDRTLNRLYAKHVRTAADRATHVPRFSLRAAAGRFLDNEEIEATGFEEVPKDLKHVTPDMFAAEIRGTSMQPVIPDGSLCLFRHGVSGSRHGRMVLVEELGRGGNDRYTVKQYIRPPGGSRGFVTLKPLNPEHPAFEIGEDDDRFRVIAEFLQVLY